MKPFGKVFLKLFALINVKDEMRKLFPKGFTELSNDFIIESDIFFYGARLRVICGRGKTVGKSITNKS